MKSFISSLIIMTGIILAIGLLLNPATITPVFSQEGSVSIAPGAADPI
jgi:hypothetical protein